MRKTTYLIQNLLVIMLVAIIVVIFALLHNIALGVASTNDDTKETTKNYINSVLESTNEQFVGRTFWVSAEYYIANGHTQGPKAFAIGEDGTIIELPVRGYGSSAGEYIAEVDMSKVDANIVLSGDFFSVYNIIPENQFGVGGMTLVAALIILLILSGVVIGCFLYLQKKEDARNKKKYEAFQEMEQDFNEKLHDENYRNWLLDAEIKSIKLEREQYKRIATALSEDLSVLKMQLDEERAHKTPIKQQTGVSSLSYDNHVELERAVTNLKTQVSDLLKENAELKSKHLQEPDYYKHPIEDYFSYIDEAYEYAESCNYDPNNPEGSFLTQRQKLRDIMNVIATYRSQRR